MRNPPVNEKKQLADELTLHTDTAWGKAALSALADSSLVFAGSRDVSTGAAVSSLLRIYRIRLEHVRERGIEAQGLSELVDSLALRSPDEIIKVHPFDGPRYNVAAFWSPTGNLIGCVTLPVPDPSISQRNFDFARGKL